MSPVTRLGTWLMNVILFNSHNDHAKLGTTTRIFTNWEALPNITQLNKVKICIIWFWNLHTEEFYSSTEAQSAWGTCAGFSCLAQSAPQASKLLSKLSAESEATVGLFPFQLPCPTPSFTKEGLLPPDQNQLPKEAFSWWGPSLALYPWGSRVTKLRKIQVRIRASPWKRGVHKILGSSTCF